MISFGKEISLSFSGNMIFITCSLLLKQLNLVRGNLRLILIRNYDLIPNSFPTPNNMMETFSFNIRWMPGMHTAHNGAAGACADVCRAKVQVQSSAPVLAQIVSLLSFSLRSHRLIAHSLCPLGN